jgi:hypothetical protein
LKIIKKKGNVNIEHICVQKIAWLASSPLSSKLRQITDSETAVGIAASRRSKNLTRGFISKNNNIKNARKGISISFIKTIDCNCLLTMILCIFINARFPPTTIIARGKVQAPSIPMDFIRGDGIKESTLKKITINPSKIAITGGLNRFLKVLFVSLFPARRVTPKDQISKLNPRRNKNKYINKRDAICESKSAAINTKGR